MRKLASLLLAAVLVLTMGLTALAADTAEFTVSIDKSEVPAGEEFTVDVAIGPVADVGGMTASLQYDTASLTLVSAALGSAFPAADCTLNDDQQGAGEVVLLFVTNTTHAIAAKSTAFSATFRVKDGVTGDVTPEFKVENIFDGANMDDIIYTVDNNAAVTAIEPPVVVNYTITATAGTGGRVTGGGTYQENAPVTLVAIANRSYSFEGWYENDVKIDGAAATYTFTATGDRVLEARFTYQPPVETERPGVVGGNVTSSSDSSGSSSGGSAVVVEPKVTGPYWITATEAKRLAKIATDNSRDYARSRRAAGVGIRKDALAALEGLRYDHDTLDNGKVAVRLSIPKPEAVGADLLVSGYVTGARVTSVRNFFGRYYSNQLAVIAFEQQGSWGQTVEVAAALDLTGMDADNLYFYAYNKEDNQYKRLQDTGYWVDSNGYVHFKTSYAGSIVVSDGALAK